MLQGALISVLLLTIAATALPWPVAETRIANSTYPSGPLGSPKNDAEAVAKKLNDLGFVVTKLTNFGGPALHTATRNFGQQLEQPETVGLFYYSGYGIQVSNRNYDTPGQDLISQNPYFVLLGVDIVFVMEMGVRMAPYIQNTAKAVVAIARLITQDPETAERVRFGFVGYRDDVKKMPWLEFTAKNFTPDGLLEVSEFLNVMGMVNPMMAAFVAEGRGSGDYQEEMYAGLREALSTKWSDASLRFVVLVGAASSHEVGHPQNTTGLDALTLRQQLNAEKINVIALHIRDERAMPDHALAQQQLTTLATNEGGGLPYYYSLKPSDMESYNQAVKDIGTALTELLAKLHKGGD